MRWLAILLLQIGIFSPGVFVPQHAGGGGITAGDLITCEFAFNWNQTVSSFTDTLNSASFNSLQVPSFGGSFDQTVGIYYFSNSIHGSSDTITLTINGSQPHSVIACQAWKNAATSSVADSGTNNPGNTSITTSTNPTSGNFTTTVNGNLIIGPMVNLSVTPTAGNGTLIDTVSA